jgi:hypothetical protein
VLLVVTLLLKDVLVQVEVFDQVADLPQIGLHCGSEVNDYYYEKKFLLEQWGFIIYTIV